jgi:ATP-binding cassette subfamily C (CFTR/MRP) protein 1
VSFVIQANVSGTNQLTTNKAFTSLSIITLITLPAAQLISAIPNTVACLGCFERIQKYLVTPSRVDQRAVLKPKAGSSDGSSLGVSREDIPLGHLQTEDDYQPDTNGLAISLRKLSVRAAKTAELAIRDVSVDFEMGTVNLVTGPVGCGKSTMMRAILGELLYESGSVTVSSTEMSYCSQTPWLLNASIQQIIRGPDSNCTVDEEWYQTVLYACALNEDVLQFPRGDESIIGNRGLTLSGGQKQRLVIIFDPFPIIIQRR